MSMSVSFCRNYWNWIQVFHSFSLSHSVLLLFSCSFLHFLSLFFLCDLYFFVGSIGDSLQNSVYLFLSFSSPLSFYLPLFFWHFLFSSSYYKLVIFYLILCIFFPHKKKKKNVTKHDLNNLVFITISFIFTFFFPSYLILYKFAIPSHIF